MQTLFHSKTFQTKTLRCSFGCSVACICQGLLLFLVVMVLLPASHMLIAAHAAQMAVMSWAIKAFYQANPDVKKKYLLECFHAECYYHTVKLCSNPVIWRIDVDDFSRLWHCKQTRRPTVMLVQNVCHVQLAYLRQAARRRSGSITSPVVLLCHLRPAASICTCESECPTGFLKYILNRRW